MNKPKIQIRIFSSKRYKSNTFKPYFGFTIDIWNIKIHYF